MDINPSRILFGSPIVDNYNPETEEIETYRNGGDTRTSEILNVMMDWIYTDSIFTMREAKKCINQLLSDSTDDMIKINSFNRLKTFIDHEHKDKFQKREIVENHFPMLHYEINLEGNGIKNLEFKISFERYMSVSERIEYANNDKYTSALKHQISLVNAGKTDDDAIAEVNFKNLSQNAK